MRFDFRVIADGNSLSTPATELTSTLATVAPLYEWSVIDMCMRLNTAHGTCSIHVDHAEEHRKAIWEQVARRNTESLLISYSMPSLTAEGWSRSTLRFCVQLLHAL
eukprot:IDg16010t1